MVIRGETDVFSGFSLDVDPGQRIGLVGPSGGGKSTLFALIQRYYPARSGRILIDGQDIALATEDEPVLGDRGCAAGHGAAEPHSARKHPLWPAGGE